MDTDSNPTNAPLADGTRIDCVEYTDSNSGDVPCDCLVPGVSLLDFAAWNPSVEWYNCVLADNTRYCSLLHEPFLEPYVPDDEDSLYVDIPGNAASVSTSACHKWYEVVEGESFYYNLRTDVVEVSYLRILLSICRGYMRFVDI
jgi:hypothetical protein